MCGNSFLIVLVASMPFIPGKPKSIKITSGHKFLAKDTPCSAVSVSPITEIPSNSSNEDFNPILVSL